MTKRTKEPGVWFENAEEVLGAIQNLTKDGDIDLASILFLNVPTSDPGIEGRPWSDSGVLTISAG